MNTVPDSLTNGKLNPDFADFMAGAEACHTDWNTGERVFYPAEPAGYADAESPDYIGEPCFDGPTEEEEREGAEIMATMHLDSFLPRKQTFKAFLLDQARLAKIRDNSENWAWLANMLTEHAARAMFMKARTPEVYDARCEVMAGNGEAKVAVEMVRVVAGLLGTIHPSMSAELERAADRLDRYVGPMS